MYPIWIRECAASCIELDAATPCFCDTGYRANADGLYSKKDPASKVPEGITEPTTAEEHKQLVCSEYECPELYG